VIDDNCSIRYGYRFATLAKVLDVYIFLNQSGYMASPSKPCTMALIYLVLVHDRQRASAHCASGRPRGVCTCTSPEAG